MMLLGNGRPPRSGGGGGGSNSDAVVLKDDALTRKKSCTLDKRGLEEHPAAADLPVAHPAQTGPKSNFALLEMRLVLPWDGLSVYIIILSDMDVRCSLITVSTGHSTLANPNVLILMEAGDKADTCHCGFIAGEASR